MPREVLEGGLLGEIDLARHLLDDYRNDRGRWKKRYYDQDFCDSLRDSMVMAWHYTLNRAESDWAAPPHGDSEFIVSSPRGIFYDFQNE